MAKSRVKVAAIQLKTSDNLDFNLKSALSLTERAAKSGAKIICLPELYRTIYFPQYSKIKKENFAETIPGESTRAFSKLAIKYRVTIIVPLFEKQKNDYYNSAAVISENGKLLTTYRKNHIPHDPGFYEKGYFQESRNGYKIYKTKFATFAVLICYDQWFPEAARVARLQGAEVIFYPTAIGNILSYKAEGDWHNAWETIQRGHAIANSLYVVGVNRVGIEGRMQFFGQSFISDPFGQVLKRAGKKQQILVADLDLEKNKFYSEGWGFLRNRRPDTYKLLTSNRLVDKSKKLKKVTHYKAMKEALR